MPAARRRPADPAPEPACPTGAPGQPIELTLDHTDEDWEGKLAPYLALFDVLGRRWSLRVLWELRDGPLTFRALRERAGGMSSSVLTDRLRDLRTAQVIAHDPAGGYHLTDIGREVSARIIDLYFALQRRDDWPPPA